MDAQRFDRFARALATERSRRSIVGMLVVGVLTALAGSQVEAAGTPRALRPTRRCSRSNNVQCGGGCCSSHDVCVSGQGCMPSGDTPCGGGYCTAHLVCDNNASCVHCTNAVEFCGGDCGPCPTGAGCHVDADCASGFCLSGVCGGCQDNTECDPGAPVCVNGQCVECAEAGDCPAGRGICDNNACRPCQDSTECSVAERPICAEGDCRACQSDAECQDLLGPAVTCQNGGCGGHCRDGRISGDESDQDCGGSCDPCANGLKCFVDGDCQSGHCDNGMCVECEDSTQCLGVDGPICDAGACRPCRNDTECQDVLGPDVTCQNGACGGHCTDGRISGDESDVDCGGSCGSTCVVGNGCRSAADCASGICTSTICRCGDDVDCPRGQTCTADTHVCLNACLDGVKDGHETDIDCGGPDCPPCKAGQRCTADRDCVSGSCGVVTPLTCDCRGNADCLNGQTCVQGACVDRCHNGVRDGDESDVDCGGSCSPCGNGGNCFVDGDCGSGFCDPETNTCAAQSCGTLSFCCDHPGECCSTGEFLDVYLFDTPCTNFGDCNPLAHSDCFRQHCALALCGSSATGCNPTQAPGHVDCVILP